MKNTATENTARHLTFDTEQYERAQEFLRHARRAVTADDRAALREFSIKWSDSSSTLIKHQMRAGEEFQAHGMRYVHMGEGVFIVVVDNAILAIPT